MNEEVDLCCHGTQAVLYMPVHIHMSKASHSLTTESLIES